MNYLRLLFSATALLMMTGCFQASTVVRVNPDGSGTIEETLLLSKKVMAQIGEMMQGLSGEGDPNAKPEPLNLFDPTKLKAEAAAMGEGVTYLSGERVATADFSGYRAVYAFTDINRLKLNQQAGESSGGVKPAELPIIFHFEQGSPATLTIEQPKSKPEKAAAPEGEPVPAKAVPEGMADEQAKQLAEMFMEMRFLLALEVNGTIVKTNATHRDGRRLTIVDFDLGKFSACLPLLEKLGQLKSNSSIEEAMVLLKDFPGMKIDLNEKLTVVFRK